MGRLRLLVACATLLAAGPSWAGSIAISSAATAGTTFSNGTYTCGGVAPCTLEVTELVTALASGDVTVAASGAGADVVVANAIVWASGNQLTLAAVNDIVLQADITATGLGSLTLRADAACASDGGIVPNTAAITANTFAYSHDDVNLAATVVAGTLRFFRLVDTTTELSTLLSAAPTGAFALGCDMTDSGGYVPVPTFAGVLDGLGHAVIDLLVPAGNGLFTALTAGATVRNLVLVRPSVTSAGDNVGALAGTATQAVIADVAVLDTTIVGANKVGGIVGAVVGSNLDRLYCSGRVTGASDTGGIVGALDGEGIAIGGTAARLADVMSKARVNGGDRVGGIAGSVGVTNGLVAASVTDAWSAGAVTGGPSLGGAVGAVGVFGSASNVYWDTQTSGVASDSIAGTTGLATADMRQQASFTGFDFGATWAIRAEISRPFLRSLRRLLDVTVAVSGSSPTVITETASFTAVVTPNTSYELPATGAVFFFDGTAAIDSGTLVAGAVTIGTATLGLGSHTIRAVHDGNAYHIESEGSVTHTVNAGDTQTTLTAQDGPIVATVTAVAPATGVPSGSVTFNVDGVNRAPVALAGPTATLDPSTLGAGVHTIVATFASDDGRFGPSTSSSIQVTVVGPTTTTLAQSSASTALGEAFDLVATVTSSEGTPGGTVRFIADGAEQLAEVTLAAGAASTRVTTLSAGSHVIVAQFLPATSDFTASVSAQIIHGVAKADSTTNLTVADVRDGVLTLNVEVLRPATPLPLPSGDVVFTIDDVDVGDAALVGGVATFTSEQLARGTHLLAARYDGDVNYNGSAASPVEVAIELDGFRLAANPRRSVTFAGGSVPFTLTLTPEAGTFGERVTFACDDLPPGGSCTFSPASTDIASVGTLVGLLVNTQRPILASGLMLPRLPPGAWLAGLLAGAAVLLRRLALRTRLAGLAMAVLVACTDSPGTLEPREGTPPGTYTVTVRARGETVSRVTTVEIEVR